MAEGVVRSEPVAIGDGSNTAELLAAVAAAVADWRAQQTKLERLRELAAELEEQRARELEAWLEVQVAELVRHLPGLAPTIRLLWEHIKNTEERGRCCLSDARVDEGRPSDA